MALKESNVNSLVELVSHVLGRQEETPRRLWFRGSGCSDRPLLPSLYRKMDQQLDASQMLSTEARLITRFRQRSLALWPEGYPQDDWEHLFAMQHFGVPTRLLDWSESALTAAFFAADHDPTRCECGQATCQPVVWILDPDTLNKNLARFEDMDVGVLATSDQDLDIWAPGVDATRMARDPVAIHGTHNSPRIVAQQGTFTVLGKGRDANGTCPASTPLERSKVVEDHDDVLEKVTLDTRHSQIMTELKSLGVSRSSVYPGLETLSKDIAEEELG